MLKKYITYKVITLQTWACELFHFIIKTLNVFVFVPDRNKELIEIYFPFRVEVSKPKKTIFFIDATPRSRTDSPDRTRMGRSDVRRISGFRGQKMFDKKQRRKGYNRHRQRKGNLQSEQILLSWTVWKVNSLFIMISNELIPIPTLNT